MKSGESKVPDLDTFLERAKVLIPNDAERRLALVCLRFLVGGKGPE